MADDNHNETENAVRAALLQMLLDRIEEDQFPSSSTMDIIEMLLETPEDVERYADILMEKISNETYPSLTQVRRVLALTDPLGRAPLRD